MRCTLMHKAVPVARIDVDEITGSIMETGETYDKRHLPVGVNTDNGAVDRASLNRWWSGRCIPGNRPGIRDLLEAAGVFSPKALLLKCPGLSLTDPYWIRLDHSELQWDHINFFSHPFSEEFGRALSGWPTDANGFDLMTPDCTTTGHLPKRWTIRDGKRFLLKSGSAPFYQEPLNEAFATEIQRRLKIRNFVPYKIEWNNGFPYTVCESFVSSRTEFVSARDIVSTEKKPESMSLYRHYLTCCERLGIPNIRESLDRMLTLDYIMANTDRHLGNFGAVRDADTLQWIGPAPLFDYGSSLGYNRVTHMVLDYEDAPSKPFCSSHSEQIRLVSSFDWYDSFALEGVGDVQYNLLKASPLIDDRRRNTLC